MSDQTPAFQSTHGATAADLTLSPSDRAILRRLAAQVPELAARPLEQEKRDLWYAHNALQPTRPLVFCDPKSGWNEIITPETLRCSGALAREWEMRLRKEVFWGTQMRDDRVIEPCFDVAHVYAETDWGMHEARIGPSLSAWADVRTMAERLEPHYIFSWKPAPSDLALPTFDEEYLRRTLREALQITHACGCRVEVIMKDNNTIRNDPRRVTRWVELVREAIERL
ncbi:MAG: hypothetical protein ACUVX9_03105 [Anaerolineae bacterium]